MSLKLYFLLLISIFSAQHLHADTELPSLGNSALSTLSIEKEKLLGDVFMRQTRASLPIDHDPLVNEYINDLGNRLVAHAEDVNFPFTFFVVNQADINAFAFFGGHIGINAGLIILSGSESELSSVLAHEIAHVTQRHLSRRIEAQRQSTPLTVAGILGGLLLAVVNPNAGIGALMATQAGAQQASINYTRSNEQEADRIGFRVLTRAGYDPFGAPDFFSKMTSQFRHLSKPPAFLLTHPLPESRVADSRLRAQQLGKRLLVPQLNFHLIQSRLIARVQFDPTQAEQYFVNEIQFQRYELLEAAEYGLALAYTDSDQLDKALILINALRAKDKMNLFYLDTLTDILIKQQKYDEILALLKKHYQLKPNNEIVTLNYANAAIAAKKPQLAIRLLKYFLLQKPAHFLATDLLTDAYKIQEDLLRYHETQARTLALLSAYPQAIQEIDLAMNFVTEDRKLDLKRLEAKKKQYRYKIKQLQSL